MPTNKKSTTENFTPEFDANQAALRKAYDAQERLKAAGPDLLAALCEVYAWFVFHGESLPASAAKLSKTVRAAIAKVDQ